MLQFSNKERAAVASLLMAVVVGVITTSLRGEVHSDKEPAAQTGMTVAGASVSGDSAKQTASDSSTAKVLVHVSGRVVKPGVYSLPEGSRVMDAIAAAQGGCDDADLEALNLAARVIDGEKITVMAIGSQPDVVSATGEGAYKAPVDINNATSQELETLPGVGPALASRIIEHRRIKGRFASVDDLDDVSGIGPKLLERIKGAAVAR